MERSVVVVEQLQLPWNATLLQAEEGLAAGATQACEDLRSGDGVGQREFVLADG